MARCLAVALAKADRRLYPSVHYVYILRSIAEPDRFYVGSTANLKKRFTDHNSGASLHTAKFRPWDLIWYCSFKTKAASERFESYLKTGSGRAFQKKHLAE
jgi:predicted GIY-YIG superfamily endonuclease